MASLFMKSRCDIIFVTIGLFNCVLSLFSSQVCLSNIGGNLFQSRNASWAAKPFKVAGKYG